jgi:AhpC/TSA family/Transposase DDE domain
VLTFYRGAWCPFCNLQLRSLQHALPEVQALGASLLAISPDVADKGFWGRDYSNQLAAVGTTLRTPGRARNQDNPHRERRLASTRLVIESVFSNLKEQMQLERHLARTPAGLAVRIAQRILALTIGILLNTLTGRPARALAAYDGR